jgi:transposase
VYVVKNGETKSTFSVMEKRRKFDKSFKQEAAQLALRRERPLRSVAEGLGIAESVLGRWVREYQKDVGNAFPGNGRLKPEEEEMRRLRRDNVDLRTENAILKKVAAIFSREPR